MKIKICGNTNFEDCLLATELGANALGFIFYKGSKRYVTPKIVQPIINNLPDEIEKVGVFVDEEISLVNEIAETTKLTKVQLHGNESASYCNSVNLPVIKAFRIKKNFDFSIIDDYSDYEILLDAYHPEIFGGTGLDFDWNEIPFGLRKKIILAGGINLNNIDQIFKKINPAWIDLVSSLEFKPGKKDHKKMKEFFKKYNSLKG